MKLRRGRDVTVYEDPITRQKPEGIARLIRDAEFQDEDLSSWDVRFHGDDAVVRRWVRAEDVLDTVA